MHTRIRLKFFFCLCVFVCEVYLLVFVLWLRYKPCVLTYPTDGIE